MKKISNPISLLAVPVIMMFLSCGNNKVKDVSNEKEHQALVNNIFFTNQPLYYYQYKNGEGIKTAHFLSSNPDESKGKKVVDIPEGSHIKVFKVYEATEENGDNFLYFTGEVFPTPTEVLEYEAPLKKKNQFFEE